MILFERRSAVCDKLQYKPHSAAGVLSLSVCSHLFSTHRPLSLLVQDAPPPCRPRSTLRSTRAGLGTRKRALLTHSGWCPGSARYPSHASPRPPSLLYAPPTTVSFRPRSPANADPLSSSTMLQVDRCSPPPLPSSPRHHTHATLYQRRERHVEQRGRSRDVSKAALARRRSEERRAALQLQDTALAQARARVVGSYQKRPLATPILDASSRASPPSSSDNTPPSSTPGASSSAVKLPSNTTPPPITRSPQTLSHAMDSSFAGKPHSSSSCAAVLNHDHESLCTSSRTHASPASLLRSEKALSPPTDLTDDDEQQYSLSEAMQRAYARCQITCPTLAATDSHSCSHMKRARILFLRTQGIEVASDDDPRIAQVRDDDFVFGDEKSLELDEECLRSLEEERAKRACHVGDRQSMTHALPRDTDEVRNTRRKDETRTGDERWQPLEMKSRRHKNAHLGSSDKADKVSAFPLNHRIGQHSECDSQGTQ